jgi:bifunctional DNase/RNase
MVEMELIGVRLELPTNTPIVLLRETGGHQRQLPIFIGQAEANAIAIALEGIATPRPMTHDLFAAVLGVLSATIERVVVTHLDNGTFFADLHLSGPGGTQVVSSRPSDAIALAVRTGTPIYAAEDLLDDLDVTVVDPITDTDSDEVVEQFREFIETVDPEYFGS